MKKDKEFQTGHHDVLGYEEAAPPSKNEIDRLKDELAKAYAKIGELKTTNAKLEIEYRNLYNETRGLRALMSQGVFRVQVITLVQEALTSQAGLFWKLVTLLNVQLDDACVETFRACEKKFLLKATQMDFDIDANPSVLAAFHRETANEEDELDRPTMSGGYHVRRSDVGEPTSEPEPESKIQPAQPVHQEAVTEVLPSMKRAERPISVPRPRQRVLSSPFDIPRSVVLAADRSGDRTTLGFEKPSAEDIAGIMAKAEEKKRLAAEMQAELDRQHEVREWLKQKK